MRRFYLDPTSPSWVLIETGAGAVFSLFSMLLISRHIGPEAAGTGAVPIAAFLLADLGGSTLFTDAVIQRRNLEPRHANTAVTASVLTGVLAALLLLVIGPLLGAGTGSSLTTRLVMALAPLLPLSAYSGVVSGLVLRRHRYRLLALRVLFGQPVGLAAGLFVAASGGGPWAMIALQAATTVTVLLLMLARSRCGLKVQWDRAAMADLWPIAGPQFLSVLVTAGRYRAFIIALGTITTETIVAVCNIAFRLLDSVLSIVWGSTFRITLPRLAAVQDDRRALAHAYGETAQLQALLGWPIAAGVAITAPEMVHGLMGPAWSAAADATRVVAVAAMISFTYGDSSSLWIAIGKTRLNFLTSVGSLIIPLTAVLALRPQTPIMAAFCWGASSILLSPLIGWLVLRELGQTPFWLLGKLVPAGIATIAMTAAVLLVRPMLPAAPLLSLVWQAGLGASVFGAVAWFALGRRVPAALVRTPVPAS